MSKFVQEDANSQGEMYPERTFYGIICGIRRHLDETVGSVRLFLCLIWFVFMHEP